MSNPDRDALRCEHHGRLPGGQGLGVVCFPRSVALLPAISELQAAVAREAIRIRQEAR